MAYEAPREVVASAARTTSGQSAGITAGGLGSRLNLEVLTTASSGTTPTLDLSVEWSPDNGTTWLVADPADAFAQITGTANGLKSKQFMLKAPMYRIRWAIAGTTPSFTFSIMEHLTG